MRKLFYAMFLMAGISFATVNVLSAQDTKAKACCSQVKATADKSSDCQKSATVTLTSNTKADSPKAGTKDCPLANKADCPKKDGSVADKKACCNKAAAAVAEAKK